MLELFGHGNVAGQLSAGGPSPAKGGAGDTEMGEAKGSDKGAASSDEDMGSEGGAGSEGDEDMGSGGSGSGSEEDDGDYGDDDDDRQTMSECPGAGTPVGGPGLLLHASWGLRLTCCCPHTCRS